MTEQALIQNLKGIVNQYTIFKEAAIGLKWFAIEENHFSWFPKYPLGINISIYEFPENYIKKNFTDAFVRCCLSELAFQEEWDKDFFDISKEQRTAYIKNAEASRMNPYKDICTWKELRLNSVTSGFLKEKVLEFVVRNGFPDKEHNKILSYLESASIVEIGGCYVGDSDYIAVGKNHIIMISCGIWD